ncbi:MAG: tyrosine-type recombinase/integrase [Acutalibacteraceae bacterium]
MIFQDGFVSDEEFESFTPHQLRHTYCSILYWSGVDLKTAQVLMGHSDLSVTANIYTHENDKVSKEAADIQSEFIKDTFNLSIS